MSDKKIEFSFTSALSGINPDTGAWLEKDHDAMAKKIRARIMSRPSGDGIHAMFIARYGMYAEFYTESTNADTVIEAVKEAIRWASNELEGAFPLRGDKTPEVIVDTKVPQPIGKTRITAALQTNLYAYPVNDEKGKEMRSKLAEELLQLDGVCGYTIYLNGAELTVRTAVTTVDDAKAHIQQLFDRYAQDKDSEFLPFANGVPDIDWRVHVIMQ